MKKNGLCRRRQKFREWSANVVLFSRITAESPIWKLLLVCSYPLS